MKILFNDHRIIFAQIEFKRNKHKFQGKINSFFTEKKTICEINPLKIRTKESFVLIETIIIIQ